jgi:iron complex outermembrane receptor protein
MPARPFDAITRRPFAVLFSLATLLAPLAAPAHGQEAGSVLAGRVTAEDGAPIADAVVLVGRTRRALTGVDGHFTIAGLAAGAYRVTVSRLGYGSVDVDVQVPHDGALRIVLERTALAIEGLTVFGSREELDEVRRRLRAVPGAVSLIESEELRATRQANFQDVLRFTPGVWVQPRFGAADESQLSVRGSGLRNNFHLRGVNLLVNGMPYRNADGFTDFESLELLTADNIQVYKGGNALRFGGSTLGGAINLDTKTGHNAEPVHAFIEGGAYGFAKAQGSSGEVLGAFDYYLSYARTQLDGYRDFADQERDRVNAHLGWVLSPKVDLRTFYFFAHVNEDLPGSLTQEEFATDPRQANATNVANRWGRDYSLHHVGLQLRTQLSPTQRLEVAPYGQFRDIVHPIFRVLDQVSRDVGAEARYENTAPIGLHSNRFTLGVQTAFGNTDNRHFENVGGESGALAKDQTEEAATFAVYGEEAFGLTPRLTAVLGVRYDRSLRRIEDEFLSDGDQTDERWFGAVMPKVGLLYELPAVDGQIFANASRTVEPPLLLELNSFSVPGFVDLEAQDAWQFEVGTRGGTERVDWEISLFDIELRDEIINLNVQPFPGAPFTVPTYRNAERTRHFGVEAGLGYRVPAPFTARDGGDEIGFRIAYTLARYEFVRDADFDGNEIPGAPEQVIQGELSYRHPSGFAIRPSVEWVPGRYFVNSANTVTNDGWLVFGIRGEWTVRSLGATAFLEVRNLTDEVYSPAVSVDDGAARYFLPADGRSLYGGLRWHP